MCDFFLLLPQIVDHQITWLVHNASILSAAGELDPLLAMKVNIDGLHNALELARRHRLRILSPSSIAAFGPTTPRDATPDVTIMRPTTIYGVSKVYVELLGEYYERRFGVDFRSLRYPGIISYQSPPGGGTTDYAVDIFWQALQHGRYECFLSSDTSLPMMFMPDCVRATVQLLQTPAERLRQRTFNVAAFSFTPAQLTAAIRTWLPRLQVTYKPDFRQRIADSWPRSLDDAEARRQWDWSPKYSLLDMCDEMLKNVALKLGKPIEVGK